MKTFEDFDLTHYRKVVYEIGTEKQTPENELEKMLFDLLDIAKDEMESKVHCLTCGVKFTLNDLQHDCQEEDIWLFEYVKNSAEKRGLKKQHISRIKEKYPFKDGEMVVFRGINFRTEKEYDSFMNEINTGTYQFQDISSWSLSYSYAKRFARCIQKGTRTDDTIRKQEIRKMFEIKANITGYKGIVLGIDITKKMVLCDISNEYIGSMDEKEVILLPGTYPALVMGEIEKECGNTKWDEAVIQRAERL